MAISPGSLPSGSLFPTFQSKNPTAVTIRPMTKRNLPISYMGVFLSGWREVHVGHAAWLRHEVQRGEQFAVVVECGIFRGEQLVAVENGVCTRKNAERLRLARETAAPRRETHFRLRQRDARGGDEPHQLEHIHRRLIFQRRSEE